MARRPRLTIAGLPHHVVQRGNNRCPTFHFTEDFVEYLQVLGQSARLHDVSIHAYVLMANHVHLLATPTTETSLSEMMQSLGTRYVSYINRRYKRTGTLWEGRFRSSVVESDRYCLECYRYIDLNPVRANIVNCPIDYIWSSCRANALGERNDLVEPHELYLALGDSREERTKRYRDLLEDAAVEQPFEIIRSSASRSLPVGSADFVEKVLAR